MNMLGSYAVVFFVIGPILKSATWRSGTKRRVYVMISRLMVQLLPRLIVAFLDKMVRDNYLRLMESNN